MATDSISSDPFSDQRAVDDTSDNANGALWQVNQYVTLTLAEDGLLVHDTLESDKSSTLLCNVLPKTNSKSKTIPYFNILWAETTKTKITIHYAEPRSCSPQSSVRVRALVYLVQATSVFTEAFASAWTSELLQHAYSSAQRNKRIKVLVNPRGGKGKAVKIYKQEVEPVLKAARCILDVETTAYAGHAKDIAQKLDINSYDVLASASGDGLPHECINGLAAKPNAGEALHKIAVVQLPCGSGNAMSWNVSGTADPSLAALCIVKGLRTPLDLASVTQGKNRTLSFLSQSIAIVAETDLGTDNMRWMGDLRFLVGVVARLLGKTVYPIEIAVKPEITDKQEIRKHYAREATRIKQGKGRSPVKAPSAGAPLPSLRYGTPDSPISVEEGWTRLEPYPNLGNFYCGNMSIMTKDAVFFPAALPSDGLLDLLTIDGDVSRLQAFKFLGDAFSGALFDNPLTKFQKISAVRVIPRFGKWAERNKEAQRASRFGKIVERLGLAGKTGTQDGGFFSVDGEKMPFEPFQVEIHQALGMTLSKRPGMYEGTGPPGWENVDVEV